MTENAWKVRPCINCGRPATAPEDCPAEDDGSHTFWMDGELVEVVPAGSARLLADALEAAAKVLVDAARTARLDEQLGVANRYSEQAAVARSALDAYREGRDEA